MWIAKNSITGKTYGSQFKSIYDCQAFIDKNLMYLEIEMQRCFALEESIISKLEKRAKGMYLLEEINSTIDDGIKSLQKKLNPYFEVMCDSVITGQYEKANKRFIELYLTDWHKNNVIRCWNVEQKRFADGFDF